MGTYSTSSKGKSKQDMPLKDRVINTTITVLLLFGIFSLLPYYIPAASLKQEPRDLVFEESDFRVVSGVNLHYRVWESKGSSLGNIVLVHGYGGSTFSWRHTAPALSEARYRVVAVDLPGFGLSERRHGLDHSQAGRANLLWTLLNRIAPDESWHLVGHSIGGGTVAEMALQQPGRVDTVTFVSADIYKSPSRVGKLFSSYRPIRQWVKILGPRIFFSGERLKSIISSAYGREPDEGEFQGYRLPLNIAGSDAVLADLTGQGSGTVGPVSSLSVPALCIWGEKDSWAPLARGEELSKQLTQGELVIIKDEGHCPMETAPQEFNKSFLQFLQDHP
ncbi:MAG TPA: alpha/beta hydrolase [Firmicutes bacterium]|nr:alpha/beta hydrolase [Bacillota bacterium]